MAEDRSGKGLTIIIGKGLTYDGQCDTTDAGVMGDGSCLLPCWGSGAALGVDGL